MDFVDPFRSSKRVGRVVMRRKAFFRRVGASENGPRKGNGPSGWVARGAGEARKIVFWDEIDFANIVRVSLMSALSSVLGLLDKLIAFLRVPSRG